MAYDQDNNEINQINSDGSGTEVALVYNNSAEDDKKWADQNEPYEFDKPVKFSAVESDTVTSFSASDTAAEVNIASNNTTGTAASTNTASTASNDAAPTTTIAAAAPTSTTSNATNSAPIAANPSRSTTDLRNYVTAGASNPTSTTRDVAGNKLSFADALSLGGRAIIDNESTMAKELLADPAKQKWYMAEVEKKSGLKPKDFNDARNIVATIQGQTYQQISTATGKPVSTVTSELQAVAQAAPAGNVPGAVQAKATEMLAPRTPSVVNTTPQRTLTASAAGGLSTSNNSSIPASSGGAMRGRATNTTNNDVTTVVVGSILNNIIDNVFGNNNKATVVYTNPYPNTVYTPPVGTVFNPGVYNNTPTVVYNPGQIIQSRQTVTIPEGISTLFLRNNIAETVRDFNQFGGQPSYTTVNNFDVRTDSLQLLRNAIAYTCLATTDRGNAALVFKDPTTGNTSITVVTGVTREQLYSRIEAVG